MRIREKNELCTQVATFCAGSSGADATASTVRRFTVLHILLAWLTGAVDIHITRSSPVCSNLNLYLRNGRTCPTRTFAT
eukprot:6174690-Pleurochrysis_carterae.AAC.1